MIFMINQSKQSSSNIDKKSLPSTPKIEWPAFLENIPAILYQSNLNHLWDLEILRGNCTTLLGCTIEDFISGTLKISDLISQSDANYIQKSIKQSITDKKPFCLVYQMKHANGTQVWVKDSGNPIFDEFGSFQCLAGHISDYSEPKKYEINATSVIQKHSHFLETIPIALIEYDLEHKIFNWNEKAQKIFGYSKSEVIGKDVVSKLVPVDLHLSIKKVIDNLIESKTSSIHVNKNITISGNQIICEWYNTPILDSHGEVIGISSMAQDITDRIAIEESIKEREEIFRTMSEQSILGMFLTKGKSFVFVNEGFAQIMGYSVNDISNWNVEQKLREIVHPDDRMEFLKVHDQKLKGKTGLVPKEYRIIRSDGKIRWVHHYSKPIESKFGRLIQGIILDITEQKKSSLDLEESERKFRAITDQTFVGINVTQDGLTKYSNRASEVIIGYSQAERDLWGKDENLNLIFEDDREYVSNLFTEDQEMTDDRLLEYTYRINTKDGSVKWIEDYSKKISFNGLPAWLSIILDVTDKRKMEEEIIKSSKLESLGVLAGGIAHDFNNLLTSIIGNLSIASLEIEDNQSSLRELISEAESACIRAAQLTKQLLTFSKGGAPIKKSEAISHIISDTVQFLLRGSNIQLESQIDKNLSEVNVDVGQISQVIQNIVINAKQAMPRGGTIQISARNYVASKNDPRFSTRNGEKYVRISIADTGIGIPREFLTKIFDPYFTTKESGSGLGLAMCYSIIRKHDGVLLVESEVGVGTTFTIYIPAWLKSKNM